MSATATEDRLADLEQRLADLEGTAGEGLQNNVLTTDPSGVIGADFAGTISAKGITLPVGDSLPIPPKVASVEWLAQPGGALVARLGAIYNTGGLANVQLAAQAETSTDTSQVQLLANDDLGTDRAFLTVQQSNRGGTTNSFVQCGAGGGGNATLSDGNGNAVFPGGLTAARFAGPDFAGVTLTDNNLHSITLAWNGASLQWFVDGTAVHCA